MGKSFFSSFGFPLKPPPPKLEKMFLLFLWFPFKATNQGAPRSSPQDGPSGSLGLRRPAVGGAGRGGGGADGGAGGVGGGGGAGLVGLLRADGAVAKGRWGRWALSVKHGINLEAWMVKEAFRAESTGDSRLVELCAESLSTHTLRLSNPPRSSTKTSAGRLITARFAFFRWNEGPRHVFRAPPNWFL